MTLRIIKKNKSGSGKFRLIKKTKKEVKPKKKEPAKPNIGDWNNKWVASVKKMIIKRRAKRA